MALLPQAANTEENNAGIDDRSPWADGDHPVTITKSEYKPTKAKTGHFLALTLKCFEGPCSGKLQFVNLNLDNPNPVAVEIATKELNSICQALSLFGVEDSEELHGQPFIIRTVEDNSNPQYPGNKITAYLPYEGDAEVPVEALPEAIGATATATAAAAKVGKAPQSKTPKEPVKLPWQ